MLSKIDEIKLLAQCVLTDNRDAFGRLVENYQGEIRRFFLNLTFGDHALSDDLAQETFIKAYLNIRGFKGLSRFKTWLFRIAYNEYYSHLRKLHEVPADEQWNLPDTETIDNFSGIDAGIDVRKALKQLSENERIVIILFYLEDQPLKKIKEITGMPEGTIKSHLSRGKEKLGRILKTLD